MTNITPTAQILVVDHCAFWFILVVSYDRIYCIENISICNPREYLTKAEEYVRNDLWDQDIFDFVGSYGYAIEEDNIQYADERIRKELEYMVRRRNEIKSR